MDGSFEDIAAILDALDSVRLGVCLDTCHLFGAGYELRTPDGIMLRKIAVVAPPAVLPRIMASLLTGATIISLRKPNSLSQRTESPVKVAENIESCRLFRASGN